MMTLELQIFIVEVLTQPEYPAIILGLYANVSELVNIKITTLLDVFVPDVVPLIKPYVTDNIILILLPVALLAVVGLFILLIKCAKQGKFKKILILAMGLILWNGILRT